MSKVVKQDLLEISKNNHGKLINLFNDFANSLNNNNIKKDAI